MSATKTGRTIGSLIKLQRVCRYQPHARPKTGNVRQCLVVVRRNLCRTEDTVPGRGMPVRHKRHRITKGKRAPGCGINAKITLEPAHHKLIDSVLIQKLFQVSFMERIRGALSNSQIPRINPKSISELPTGRAVNKLPVVGLVLNENDKHPCGPGLRSRDINCVDHARSLEHCKLASTQCLLNVDDEKRGTQSRSPTECLTIVA